MRIVFMGTPSFAVPSLEKLMEEGHTIDLVITQPDRRGNRGKMTFSPVKERAIEHHIPVMQPQSIRKDEALIQILEQMQPDMIVVAAFGQILPERVLQIPLYGCVNVHGSLLPKLRGAAPMQYAILEGLERTGVTIMKMAKGLDTGDMIAQTSIAIRGMNIHELDRRLSEAGAELLVQTIPDIEKGIATYIPQNNDEASYAPMIRKEDGRTGFAADAEAEERRMRAFDPWPSLYSYLHGKQIKFFRAEVLDDAQSHNPGIVSEVARDSFVIDCAAGRLRILELQMQGKKRMDAASFLRGCHLKEGDRFEEA